MQYILMPFSWLLLFFYNFLNSYGLALILFAIVIKVILFPVTLKSKKSMIQTTMLSGKMQQLQKQYGKDRERYNLEVQKLYEREHVNPMGGCLWSMIPLVLLIALYAIIREPLVNLMDVPKDMIDTVAGITGIANTGAYPQIYMAEAMNDPAILQSVKDALGEAGSKVFAMDFRFLGINLASVPTWKFWANGLSWSSIGLTILPLVSTVISFLSMKVSMDTNKINSAQPKNDQMERTNKTMLWTMPLMSLWIGFTVPAGLSIYWIAQYLVNMIQELICAKLLKKDYEAARVAAEEQARQAKEDEKRRKEEARLERARRAEEEKKNKKKKLPKADPAEPGVDPNDSKEGIRAHARGRSYSPNRYTVTDYTDPNLLLGQLAMSKKERKAAEKAEQEAKKAQAETKSETETKPQQQSEPKPETPAPETQEPVQAPAPEENAAPEQSAQQPEQEQQKEEN